MLRITINRCGIGREGSLVVVKHELILKALLDIELESPLRQGVHLDNELVRPVLSRLSCVVCLDQVDLQSLVQKDDNVLEQAIHLDDEVHHVFSVDLVCLHLVNLLKIVLIGLERQHFQEAIFSLVKNSTQAHHLWL